jgi:hypothetical protein
LSSTARPLTRTAFFRDILGFRSIDAGHGWLIFALPPTEAAIHPIDTGASDTGASDAGASDRAAGFLDAALYLMCDDLDAAIASFKAKNVECGEVQAAGWGRVTTIPLPSGGKIGLYQPRHATAFDADSR